MRTPKEQREFEHMLRAYVQRGGEVKRYDPGARSPDGPVNQWRTVGPGAHRLNELRKRSKG